ncbi:helix-turn-helix domain-containing protein [Pseudomonas sp. W5-36]|uniref:helix-turn-helix domain-containing protein n=1 Tax=Pseudomonas sp. W5-36 TaxID=3097455 RepID=UPI00397927F2
MKSIHSEPYQRLLVLLIKQRKQSSITQEQLSKALSRPQSFVSKYERGERRLDVIEFLEVCRHLDADAYEILRALERQQRS